MIALSQRVVARDARAPTPVGAVLSIKGGWALVQWDDGEATWSRIDLLVPAQRCEEPDTGATR